MTRARANRRRREPFSIPSLPKFKINWRAIAFPPLVVIAAVACVSAGRAWLDHPVTGLTVEGAFQRVQPIQIEAALASVGSQRFFTLDLDELKEGVAAIDWVDTVELRRVWPGQVHVSVTEHRAAASWGESGLLNTRGELFTEAARFDYAELPKLDGPLGSEQRVAALYLDLRERLADANLVLASLSMDDRGAIEFSLSGGQQIRLGRDSHELRVDRFFATAAPALAVELDQVRYIDLRYPNGFAVGWLDPEPEVATQLAQVGDRG
jgi:cell division protein FtsQ